MRKSLNNSAPLCLKKLEDQESEVEIRKLLRRMHRADMIYCVQLVKTELDANYERRRRSNFNKACGDIWASLESRFPFYSPFAISDLVRVTR